MADLVNPTAAAPKPPANTTFAQRAKGETPGDYETSIERSTFAERAKGEATTKAVEPDEAEVENKAVAKKAATKKTTDA